MTLTLAQATHLVREIMAYRRDYLIASGALDEQYYAGVAEIQRTLNYTGNDIGVILDLSGSAQNRTKNAFDVLGAQKVIEYEKYVTPDIEPFKLIVSNSSNIFGLQFYPTASSNSRLIFLSGSTLLTKANPITLLPRSGSEESTVEITVDVRTNALDLEPEESRVSGNQLVENITFNLTALDPGTVSNSPALPGYPNETEIYQVNYLTSDEWKIGTPLNSTKTGLGNDYIPIPESDPSSYNSIRFTYATLEEKRSKLLQLKGWINLGFLVNAGNNGVFSALSNSTIVTALIYGCLHPSYYPKLNFSDFNNISARNGDVNRILINWGITNARDIISVQQLPKQIQNWIGTRRVPPGLGDEYTRFTNFIDLYITLIEEIIKPTEGLSKQLPRIVVSGFIPNEASRANVDVGYVDVDVYKARYSFSEAILSASRQLINLKTAQFFDETREYKTILNFGIDKQNLIEAWRPIARDSASVQFKLVNPLDEDILLEESAYIVKEFAKPIIDVIDIRQPPFVDRTPYLRPLNMDVGKYNTTKQSINNVTLTTLGLETGSYGQISASLMSYEDKVFNRWYTADYKASELNIDFSDYANFVTFGSAKARLNAFVQKLKKIQQLNVSASLSSSNEGEKIKALEKEYIIRNMDPYEQYLYFAPITFPYSASAYYIDGGIEYNPTGSWPKDTSNKLLSFDNVQDWYSAQSQIAERYDTFNYNRLKRHLPEHIQEDSQSEEFLQFIDMFGHMMDNIKIYIDQFPNIYSTNPDPFEELSMDQVYEVAKSFGMNLPNVYSLETLQNFIESLYDEAGSRALVAETWKRFMHNLPLLYKSKGTRTSLDLLLNIYGISTPAIQAKESGYPTQVDYIKSDEYSNTLRFSSASVNVITIPFVSSSILASSFQIRFNPTLKKTSTLLHNGSGWAVDLVTHPSASVIYNKIMYVSGSARFISQENKMDTYGQIRVVSGSSRTVLGSTDFFPLFTDDFTHLMLRSQSNDITIIQTDGDQILFQQSASINWGPLWNTTSKIYVGGTSSISVGSFDGLVDEVHVWKNNISTDQFVNQAYDPGSYYGNTYTSAYDSLYVHLGFSQASVSVTQSIENESPYSSGSRIEPILTTKFTTSSYEKILRTIKQYVPTAGAVAYSDTKVRIASPPTFSEKFVDGDGSYNLSRTNSIKQLEDKIYTSGLDVLWFAVSPTDFVNQTILRSMGVIDVNYLIGTPRILRNERYKELDELLEFYQEHYNKNINVNQYIRFYKNLLKAPTEYVKENIPVRINLLDGIVIESPILDRKRVDIQRTVRVDGANTVTFEKFVTGSGSANVGAYQFDADYPLYVPKDTTVITKPILQYTNDRIGQDSMLVTSSLVSRNSSFATIPSTIELKDTVMAVSSQKIENMPSHRNFLQNVTTNTNTASFVVSSLVDKGSGIGYVDSVLDASSNNTPVVAGYSRNPYLGILTGSVYRINSEKNTKTPFYAIESVSNFSDVGTTTYFYTTTGIHWFDTRTIAKNIKLVDSGFLGTTARGAARPEGIRRDINLEPKYEVHRKQLYKAKFDLKKGEVESVISDLFANITLLDPTALTDYPGRESTIIQGRTYIPGVPHFGILKIANIFSLLGIVGTPGLRIRLYSTATDQSSDWSRPISSPPQVNVMFDSILPENDNLVFPYTLIQTVNSTIFFTIDNTTGTDITSELELFYFEYEPSSLVPIGYLPRHYKFTRHEPAAQRRRNYVGCKLTFCPEGCTDDVLQIKNYLGRTNTRVTTRIEEESPVLIFTSPRTSPIVRRTTGGGPSTPPRPAGQPSPLDDITINGGRGKLDDKKK